MVNLVEKFMMKVCVLLFDVYDIIMLGLLQ